MKTTRKIVMIMATMWTVPFVAIYGITQGPDLYKKWFPTFSVERVESMKETGEGFALEGITLRFEKSCNADRVLYISTPHVTGFSHDDIIMPTLDDDGKQHHMPGLVDPGEQVSIGRVHVVTSKPVTKALTELRFLLFCHDLNLGAYQRVQSNSVTVRR